LLGSAGRRRRIDEYVSVEIKEFGAIEEVIGLDFSVTELDEIVGIKVLQLPDAKKFEKVAELEVSLRRGMTKLV
jgi:hypothetical protein